MPELHRIQDYYRALIASQHADRMGTDVAGSAGHKDGHVRSSFVRNQSIIRVRPARSEIVGCQP